MSSHEIAQGYEFLTATLSGDSALQGYCPGGVWRGMAPAGTAEPFIVVTFMAASDVLTGNAVRVLSKPLFQVKAVGPQSVMDALVNAASRIDALLKLTGGTATGGYIDACYRESPYALEEPPVAGVVFTSLGGLYRLEVQLTS